ncbi:hypothetical protein [Parasitella parasitica]|uniref:Uncharacterized protein n=1 Tax=Parasitella parasitica TaxID=35722 RepID=A0A0B7N5K5_9FUNG|nr:hypothetical protein [Parasitella parasitica]
MNTVVAYPSSNNSMTKQLEPSVLSTPHTTRRKSSVSFDLPPEEEQQQDEAEKKEQELLSPCMTSPTIDINAQSVPDTMLVALVDRSSEMRDLVRINEPFFAKIANHLGTTTKWTRFENTLYCERSDMSDSDWLKRISRALQSAPSILEQFKDLVGFIPEYPTMDDDDDDVNSEPAFSHVDLTLIRSKLDRLSQENYPQFYINCKEAMHESKHTYFLNLLKNSNLSDEIWASEMHHAFKDHANLLEQFQEIVAYETEQEERVY